MSVPTLLFLASAIVIGVAAVLRRSLPLAGACLFVAAFAARGL